MRTRQFRNLCSLFSRKPIRGRSASNGSAAELLESRQLLTAILQAEEHAFEQNEVLIQYLPNASAAARQQTYKAVGGQKLETIRTPMMARTGVGDIERVSLGGGMDVSRAMEALLKNPNVASVSPNYIYQRAAVSNDPFYTTNSNLWGMYGSDSPTSVGGSGTTNQFGIDAERAWNDNITGSANIVVGIIDEGIQVTHPDLRDNIWVNPYDPVDGIDNDGNGYVDDVNGWDFVNNNNSVYDAGEDSHGTHVAGTIGGTGGNGIGVVGVNWDVTMISAKFLGPNGGTTANAVKAVDYLTDLKIRHGINMVATNNSWGGGGYSQSLHDAIIRSAKRDILFVAAAGNSTTNNDTSASYPSNYDTTIGTSTQTAASYDGVIAVASITNTGTISSFSSYGATTVDIGAPGSGINSSVPVDTYANYSGTSMATPHVTGAVALFASLQSAGVSGATVRAALLESATPTASLSGKTVTGGRLNVYNALQRASSIRMDQSTYGADSTITVSVLNAGANLNSGAVETLTAELTSTTETMAEVITLTETGADTGMFTGTIVTAGGPAVIDGKLQIANGDTISAYNVGINKTATAVVDMQAPTISSLSSAPRTNTVDIMWTTNEWATTEVFYGTSSSSLSTTYHDSALIVSHKAVLTGLSPATMYYYQ
ncbi:MAG: S8 family serine peptidase, partial [Planctomycetota bacterium]